MYRGISKDQFRNLMVYRLKHLCYTDFTVGEKVHIIRERTLLDKSDPKYSLTTDGVVESINNYDIAIRVDDKLQYIRWELGYGMETKSKEFLYTTYLISGDADLDFALNNHLFYVVVNIKLGLQGITTNFVREIPIFAKDLDDARAIFKSYAQFDIKFAKPDGAIQTVFRQIT